VRSLSWPQAYVTVAHNVSRAYTTDPTRETDCAFMLQALVLARQAATCGRFDRSVLFGTGASWEPATMPRLP